MKKRRMTTAEREAQREADYNEFHRQVRVLRIRPWEDVFVPIRTRGKRNPFEKFTPEHDRWERMAAIQRRLDERRVKRAGEKQQHLEDE